MSPTDRNNPLYARDSVPRSDRARRANAATTPPGMTQGTFILATALLNRGAERGLTIETLAPRYAISFREARDAMGAVADVLRRRAHGIPAGVENLRLAPEIADALQPSDTFDRVAVRFGSFSAAPRTNASAQGARGVRGGDAGYHDAGASFVPLLAGTTFRSPTTTTPATPNLAAPNLGALAAQIAQAAQTVAGSAPAAPLGSTRILPNGAELREVQSLAAAWMAKNPPVTPPNFGPAYKDVDGFNGPRTKLAVANVQRKLGVARKDGVADEQTLFALRAATAVATVTPASGDYYGDGAAMLEAQTLVHTFMSRYPPMAPPDFGKDASDFDGKWGPRTRTALQQFQRDIGGVRTDGRLDLATLVALRAAVQTSPATKSNVPGNTLPPFVNVGATLPTPPAVESPAQSLDALLEQIAGTIASGSLPATPTPAQAPPVVVPTGPIVYAPPPTSTATPQTAPETTINASPGGGATAAAAGGMGMLAVFAVGAALLMSGKKKAST